uniref:Uncharacterized protein n=1 Tax=Rodentolepis nana TaxID=102285 RepID=A0A0R3TBP4_RODNA
MRRSCIHAICRRDHSLMRYLLKMCVILFQGGWWQTFTSLKELLSVNLDL